MISKHTRLLWPTMIILLLLMLQLSNFFGRRSYSFITTTASNKILELEDKEDASRASLINHHNEKETAILVTTNWIPSLPSISMIQTVFESFSYLRGFPSSAPIYITIDALPFVNPKKVTPQIIQQHQQKQIQLEEYSFNLMKYFFNHENFTNVRIISNKEHLHIGGNLNKTLELLSPETKYLYAFQHDFKFNKDVNHTLLVSAMKEFPEILKNVRFEKHPYIDRRTPADKCWNSTLLVLYFNIKGETFPRQLRGVTIIISHPWIIIRN
ncbi:hypothetical protein CTEN210_07029 [Chaetoceros tenuissimus]|uniref:Uncharacterized protein n=1 Tax=Chaetoceros tenuissimus TaxID=426638 RepID=A0AAD3H5B0_9STRA|nr:hypothetical protein CTEN210_07029 [Chaetoceros tenuissimus]